MVAICDLSIGLSVTRDELSLAALDLNDGSAFSLVYDGIQPGRRVWRRQPVRSPHVPGKVFAHAVRDRGRLVLDLVVHGETWSEVDDRIENTLRPAFDQASYTLTQTVAGVTHSWFLSEADMDQVWRAIWQAVPAARVSFEAPMIFIEA